MHSKKIHSFLLAHKNGINYSEIDDRSGCSFKKVLKELKSKKRRKTLHYSWYVFPQPYTSKGKSKTSKRFFLNDSETIEYLKNKTLKSHLFQTLKAIKSKNFKTKKEFIDYFGFVDYMKFLSFCHHFMKPKFKKYL